MIIDNTEDTIFIVEVLSKATSSGHDYIHSSPIHNMHGLLQGPGNASLPCDSVAMSSWSQQQSFSHIYEEPTQVTRVSTRTSNTTSSPIHNSNKSTYFFYFCIYPSYPKAETAFQGSLSYLNIKTL